MAREVGKVPEVSDLLETIERSRVLRQQHQAAEEAAAVAMAQLIRRYEAAGVTREQCDHPHYIHRSGDSTNVCCYCQRRPEEE